MASASDSSRLDLPCVRCPVCLNGSGQITGPRSWIYGHDPSDPFNVEVRVCDECEGTGVVTALSAAANEAISLQAVMPIVDRVMREWADERAALALWEAEGGHVDA